MLRRYLGATDVVWLGDGIVGDDTDGHIDDLTRFVDGTTLVTVVEANSRDANYAALAENRQRLRAVAAAGRTRAVGRRAADAEPLFRGERTTARKLRELLHRQRSGRAPVFDAPQDAQAIDALARAAFRSGASCRSIVARWWSAWARCIV